MGAVGRLRDEKSAIATLGRQGGARSEGQQAQSAIVLGFSRAQTKSFTSHSKGAKKRTALVYPRTLFKDKQEAEQNKKEKEFNKLKEKSKTIIVNDNPKTIRDKMIALLAE